MSDEAEPSQVDLDAQSSIAMPWWLAGCSVLPIKPTQHKQPDRPWEPLQRARMTLGQVDSWPANHGVAVICGAVSGRLEMLELEADWVDGASLSAIGDQMDVDTMDAWETLCSYGYSEQSPKGGLHVLYRLSDHDVPGNTKIATKPGDRPGTTRTKAETRGEGGYVVVAPSPGACHEWNDQPWMAIAGTPASIPTIDWATRCAIHAAIKAALDEPAPPTAPVAIPRLPMVRPAGQLSPADDYSLKTDWAEILEPIGWTLHSRNGAGLERLWTRPGKSRGDGHSASTDYMGKPGLYVWSSSADNLPIEEPLSKFFVYAHYSHGGSMSTAARDLRSQGFGTPPIARTSDANFMGDIQASEPTAKSTTEASTTVAKVSEVNGGQVAETSQSLRPYTLTEFGMRDMLRKEIAGFFTFVPVRNKWIWWDGVVWTVDFRAVKIRDRINEVITEMFHQAQRSGNSELEKFALKQMTNGKLNAFVQQLETLCGDMFDFDSKSEKLNMANGLLDLKTLELSPHSPSDMVTKVMGASYLPDAVCPSWDKYLSEVLPSEESRDFLQRMVGYTLTGNPVERALAILHGPGGTGKSRFVEMMNLMMGSYATTAAASLFESKKDSSGPSNDLNDLRGARLASVSELDHGVKMDEALVKRLTGLDRITSRGLYEENQTWMPACVIWLATNHLLKINPEDGAIWSRIKLITFDQEIKKLGKEDPFILDKLRAEADGIFNWMVEGLRKYQEVGLGAPESVKKAVQGYKEDQDAVIQFVAQGVEEGRIVKHQAQRLRATHSFTMYQEWCRDNHQLSLGRTRFYRRMESLGFARVKSEGYDFWVGLGSGNAGVLGTF